MYNCLVSLSEFNDKVEVVLCIVLRALGLVVARQFKDHLPGGVYANLSDNAPV